MKKAIKAIVLLAALSTFGQSKAQSLSDLLGSGSINDIVSSVTGGQNINAYNVVGEWNYLKPALTLESDNMLGTAAGAALSTKAEETLNEYCSKVGIVAGKFKIYLKQDGTFIFDLAKRDLKGSYTIDTKENTVSLKFEALGTMKLATIKAHCVLSGDSMALLFNADKLLKLIEFIASSTNNATIDSINSLLGTYNGVLMGFEFKQTPGTGVEEPKAEEDKKGSVGSFLGGLFGK